jgi:pilus assembly protein CpaB
MRAVTVGLDPVMGVAGFLKPGDHVDVLVTLAHGTTHVALTVLQDVRLLAIGAEVQVVRTREQPQDAAQGQPAPAQAEQQPTATLEVTPGQAQDLVLADQQGELRLTLRAATDHEQVVLDTITQKDLTGLPMPDEAGAAAGGPAQPQPVAASGEPPDWYKEPPEWLTKEFFAGEAEKPGPMGRRVEVIRGSQREVTSFND